MGVGKRRIILASRKPPTEILDNSQENRKKLGIGTTVSEEISSEYAIYLEVVTHVKIRRGTPLLLSFSVEKRSSRKKQDHFRGYDKELIDNEEGQQHRTNEWDLKEFASQCKWSKPTKVDHVLDDLEAEMKKENSNRDRVREPSMSRLMEYKGYEPYSMEMEKALEQSKRNMLVKKQESKNSKSLVKATPIKMENPHWFRPFHGDRLLNLECAQVRITDQLSERTSNDRKLLKIAKSQKDTWKCNIGAFMIRQ